ncbi:MAG: general stress protein [Clostridiaceae bacterium]
MKKIVGIYRTETQLNNAIRELLREGYESKDMSVISKYNMNFVELKEIQEDVRDDEVLIEAHSEVNDISYGSGVDSFIATLMGYGLSEEEARDYQEAIDQGGIILLLGFSDIIRGHIENPGTYTDPNIGDEMIENPGTINVKDAFDELDEDIETPGTHTDRIPNKEDIETPGTYVDPDETDEIENPGTINVDDLNK